MQNIMAREQIMHNGDQKISLEKKNNHHVS